MNFNADNSSNSGFTDENLDLTDRQFTELQIVCVGKLNILARARRYGRWWMLKALREEVADKPVNRARLRKEFEIMVSLQHPSLVSATGFEHVEPLGDCIVMEYIEGMQLDTWLQGKTTQAQRRDVAAQIIDAVEHIHACNIAHRDLKPENILICRNGLTVKIIDFGLSDTDSHAVLKQPAGTPRYMSPEQKETNVPDVRNDIYSMGVIFRSMKLGYGAVINKCLRPAEKRYSNARELREAISRRKRLRRYGSVAALTLAIAASAALAVIAYRHDDRLRLQQIEARASGLSSENEALRSQLDMQRRQTAGAESRLDSVSQELDSRRSHEMLMARIIDEGKRQIADDWHKWPFRRHVDTLSSASHFRRELMDHDFDYFIYRYLDRCKDKISSDERAVIFQTLKQFSAEKFEKDIQTKLYTLHD